MKKKIFLIRLKFFMLSLFVSLDTDLTSLYRAYYDFIGKHLKENLYPSFDIIIYYYKAYSLFLNKILLNFNDNFR